MTIKDLAALSGYSLGTVSRVLNNQPHVSEKAREQIMAIVKAHGFELNMNARSLKQTHSNNILVVVRGTHNELFAAFRELNKTDKSTRLMMVGANDNVETIDKELFEWAHQCPEVIFVGRVPREDVSKYYSAMDVFCSLSYREGFGLVVIEAAAMQLPGIVTDVPGQIDTHENMVTGITVHAKEVVCVVDAMKFYINNPDKLKEMGIEARKQVEEKYEQSR